MKNNISVRFSFGNVTQWIVRFVIVVGMNRIEIDILSLFDDMRLTYECCFVIATSTHKKKKEQQTYQYIVSFKICKQNLKGTSVAFQCEQKLFYVFKNNKGPKNQINFRFWKS